MIIRMMHDANPDPLVRIRKLSSIAIDAQARLLLSSTTAPAVLAKVSQDVIDRAQGKATQVTESRVLTFDMSNMGKIDEGIKAVQERLERIEATRKRLSSPVQVTPS